MTDIGVEASKILKRVNLSFLEEWDFNSSNARKFFAEIEKKSFLGNSLRPIKEIGRECILPCGCRLVFINGDAHTKNTIKGVPCEKHTPEYEKLKEFLIKKINKGLPITLLEKWVKEVE